MKVVYSSFHRVELTLIQADKVDDTDETQLDEPLDHKAAEVVDDVSGGLVLQMSICNSAYSAIGRCRGGTS